MLLGMGVLHFVAPKPFDSIIPEELPGSARFYTYASGVAELGTGALLIGAAHQEAGRAGRGRAFHRRVPRRTSTMCGCGGTSRWPMRLGDDGPAAAADPDDQAGDQDLPQRLSGGWLQQRGQLVGLRQRLGVTVSPDRT